MTAAKAWFWAIPGAVLPWLGALNLSGQGELPPQFQQVYGLVRSNLAGITEADLDRAAVLGLVGQLQPRVLLVTNAAPESAGADAEPPPAAGSIEATNVYEGKVGYLRIGRVESGLAAGFTAALEGLTNRQALDGLVIDLRFAAGNGFAEVPPIVGAFVADERPLLDWGAGMVRSSANSNAFSRPVLVLVNRQTAGAAEALAATLRATETALLIGARTAGGTSRFRDFVLADGQRLRIAETPIVVGAGQPVALEGAKPDIEVAVDPEQERLYLEDPYRVIARPGGRESPTGSGTNLTVAATNRSLRLTEADLVRMRREGIDAEDALRRPTEPPPKLVNDPALARALDLLKALAVVGPGRISR